MQSELLGGQSRSSFLRRSQTVKRSAASKDRIRINASDAGEFVQQFRIEAKELDDPGLCPPSIAAAHAISVRTLHLAFADTGTTVSRWIRDRRLKACYRELSRPGRTDTVTDVAFRWGFNDAAHFSRTFKKSFGVTPSSVMLSA